jgi:NDP-sugar pyrophosphorylase family protein
LAWLRDAGVADVAINLHYRPNVIVDYFGHGADRGLHLHYSHEDTILGTAGAVRRIKDWVDGSPLLVVYGDVLTDLDLRGLIEMHALIVRRDPAAVVTLSLYHVPNPTEVGLVGLDPAGKVTRFVEKPKPDEVFTDLANAGVMMLQPEVLDLIPDDTFCDFGLHVFPMLLAAGMSIYGWVVPQEAYVLDIGSPEKYAQANREWPQRRKRRIQPVQPMALAA